MARKEKMIKEKMTKVSKRDALSNSLLSQTHNGGHKWKVNAEEQTTNGQKWWIAVLIGFLFFILASTPAFKITNKLFKCIYFPRSYSNGAITLFGLFIHMLLFIIVIRIILW